MLKLNSKALASYLAHLDKKLTLSLKKSSDLTIQSTNNGIEVIFFGDGFSISHTLDDFADSDGQLTVKFEDLIVMLMDVEAVNLEEQDDKVILINQFPIFKTTYRPAISAITDDTVNLSVDDTQAFIAELLKHRSSLRKSIFEESSWLLVEFKDHQVDFRTINPKKSTHEFLTINSVSPKLSIFIDKSRIKLFEVLYQDSEIAISENALLNDRYKVVFDPVKLNPLIYKPFLFPKE